MPVQTRSAARAAALVAPPGPTPEVPAHGSRLLSLPPELRNNIYHLVLVEPRAIVIDDQRPPPPEPGLLSVCKQIRSEAIGVYFKANLFRFIIHDLDATTYIRWCVASHKRKSCHKRFEVRESYNWTNLLVWLKAYYDGRCRRVGPTKRGRGIPMVVYNLFKVVDNLSCIHALSWEQVAVNLEYMHEALKMTDSRWMES